MPRSPTSRAWLGAWELRSTDVKDGTVDDMANDDMAMWTDGLSGDHPENGRKGIRNLVAGVAAADHVNPLARQLVARNPGVVCLPASYGRGQMGRDFELSLRAMAGLAAHPNVAGCLVISFEPESGERVADLARRLGRPVETLSFLDAGGMEECLDRGSAILRRMRDAARRAKRVGLTLGELTVRLQFPPSHPPSHPPHTDP